MLLTAIAGAFLFSLLTRDSTVSHNQILFLLRTYLFGSIYSYSAFFSHVVGDHFNPYFQSLIARQLPFGASTFFEFINTFGANIALNEIQFNVSAGYKDIFSTNIYTVFTSMIIDFGLFPALFIFFILGAIAHFAWIQLVSSKTVFVALSSISLLMIMFMFVLMSFLISPFLSRFVIANAVLVLVVRTLLYVFRATSPP